MAHPPVYFKSGPGTRGYRGPSVYRTAYYTVKLDQQPHEVSVYLLRFIEQKDGKRHRRRVGIQKIY